MSRIDSGDTERILDEDLAALRRVSLENVPKLDTLAAGPARARRLTLKETLHMPVTIFRSRPWLASAAAAGVMAFILLAVPISYQRTTGQEVRLRLPGGTEPATVDKVANEFGRTLRTGDVSVLAGLEDRTEIVARVSGMSGAQARRQADSFARLLSDRHIETTATVRPLRESVSTNLFAYAAGRILEITVDARGKTDAQVEDEIRAQLEAAGLQNPVVSVTREGNETRLTVQSDGKGGAGAAPDSIQLTVDGHAPTNQTQIRVQPKPGATDEEIRAAIEAQLREKGIDATVTVTNGQISIEKNRK